MFSYTNMPATCRCFYSTKLELLGLEALLFSTPLNFINLKRFIQCDSRLLTAKSDKNGLLHGWDHTCVLLKHCHRTAAGQSACPTGHRLCQTLFNLLNFTPFGPWRAFKLVPSSYLLLFIQLLRTFMWVFDHFLIHRQFSNHGWSLKIQYFKVQAKSVTGKQSRSLDIHASLHAARHRWCFWNVFKCIAAAQWLLVLFVSISGEEQNKEALQDAEDEAQWDWTTQDKLSSSSSSSSLNSLLPALSPVPSHSVQLGLLCSPLLLYNPLHFHPPAPPFSPRMHAISLVFPTLGVFTSFSFSFFCTPVPPLRFTSSCTVFILLYFAVIICCQVRLPVFVTCARVYLKTILYCFPVYVRACVDDQYLVRASSVVTLRKHSSDGRFKRDVLKLFGRTKCPRYIFFFVVTTPASSTHVHFLSFFFC